MGAIYLSEKITALFRKKSEVDAIFIIIAAVIILIAFFAAYRVLVCSVLPTLLLPRVKKKKVDGGRGLRRFTFPEGRGVLYESIPMYRSYIKKYLLYSREEKKYISFKFSDEVDSALCRVYVYDAKGKTAKVFECLCRPLSDGISDPVALPSAASFVGLELIAVNGEKVAGNKEDTSFFGRWIVFALLTTALTVVMGMIISLITALLGEIFIRDQKSFDLFGFGLGVAASALAGIVISVLGALVFFRKNMFKVRK